MVFSLSGRTAAVTGAGGYLGSAMSAMLAKAGAHVCLLGRSLEALNVVRDGITAHGGTADCFDFDVTDQVRVQEFVTSLEGQGHGLDVLVHNAYAAPNVRSGEVQAPAFHQAYSVTVSAVADFNVAASSLLKRAVELRGDASIIHIASMYGLVSPDPSIYGLTGLASPPWYGAAKAALLQYSRYAAVHFAPIGIRVNSISPGPFPSSEIQRHYPDFVEKLKAKTPLGRVGEPDDLGAVVVFLSGGGARFITGANVVVDGGWTVS